jgi:hypothetical protein
MLVWNKARWGAFVWEIQLEDKTDVPKTLISKNSSFMCERPATMCCMCDARSQMSGACTENARHM